MVRFQVVDKGGKILFDRPLFSQRCQGLLDDKTRCTTVTTMVHPFCTSCTAKYYLVQIAPSTLKGAGLGLFAFNPEGKEGDVVFRKGDYIAPYLGERITPSELNKRYSSKRPPSDDNYVVPYAYTMENGVILDGSLYRGPAVYVNDNTKDKKRINSMFTEETTVQRLFLHATTKIRQGEEIFVPYGREYWKAKQPIVRLVD